MIKLTENDILRISEKSTDCMQYILNLYKFVFPDWDKIKNIEHWPAVNRKTALFIMDNATGNKHDFNMVWLNKGFSCDDTMPDWKVSTKKTKIIYQ